MEGSKKALWAFFGTSKATIVLNSRPKWVKMGQNAVQPAKNTVKRGQNGLKGVEIAAKWVPRLQKRCKWNMSSGKYSIRRCSFPIISHFDPILTPPRAADDPPPPLI